MPCTPIRKDGEAARECLRNAHGTRACPLVASPARLATTVDSAYGGGPFQPCASHPCPHKLSRTLGDKGKNEASAKPRQPCRQSLGLAVTFPCPFLHFPSRKSFRQSVGVLPGLPSKSTAHMACCGRIWEDPVAQLDRAS